MLSSEYIAKKERTFKLFTKHYFKLTFGSESYKTV